MEIGVTQNLDPVDVFQDYLSFDYLEARKSRPTLGADPNGCGFNLAIVAFELVHAASLMSNLMAGEIVLHAWKDYLMFESEGVQALQQSWRRCIVLHQNQ